MGQTGIIAGRGALPKLIAAALEARGETPLVVDFAGIELDWTSAHSHYTARFEQPDALFAQLRAHGCERVVMAGGMQRPQLDPASFDPTFSMMAPKLMAALGQGDNAALEVIIEMFEAAGFVVASAHEQVPELVADDGILGAVKPENPADADRAAEILQTIGPLDIGQGCVVAGGLCLAIETLPGTAAMLEFVRQTRSGDGGVLYKAPKPGQDHRVDLPAIGPDTVDQATAAGLAGIVIAAGGVLLIDRDEILRRADAANLFIWARA